MEVGIMAMWGMAENKPLWKQMQIIKMGLTTKLIIKMYCDDILFYIFSITTLPMQFFL